MIAALQHGSRFALLRETLAVVIVSGKRQAKYLPAGAILTVMSTYKPGDTSVEVEWEDQTVTMFSVDLEKRGKEIGTCDGAIAGRKKMGSLFSNLAK
jgi:hypothetical protein